MAIAKMTKKSDKIAKTGETSGKTSNQEKPMDFCFTIKPLKVLNHAFEALADIKFNVKQEAVIEVGVNGCEITVWNYNHCNGNECFGCLRLNATGLEGFQCHRFRVRKSFRFSGILNLLKAALRYQAESITLFSVEGSNQLSFKWGSSASDFGLGLPLSIPLNDVDTRFEGFPENVEYGFEAVFPSTVLRPMFEKLKSQAWNIVQVKLRPVTVEVNSGSVRAGSLEGQEHGKEYKVSMQWGYWKALESATHTADKCSIYLVTDPEDSIMLRFDLNQLGDLVFLNDADFTKLHEDLEFPDLGHFHRLNGRRNTSL